MTNYYPLIAKAVDGLQKSTPQARRSVYNRARTALLTKLGGIEPPLAEAKIARERLALEEAIHKIEREAERRFGDDPPRPSQEDENLKDMARRLEAALRRPIKPVEPAPEPPPQRRKEGEDRCQDEESDGLGEAQMSEPVPPPSNADLEVKQAMKRRAGELGRYLLREKTGLASTKLSTAEEKISDRLGEAERAHMSERVPPPSNEGVEGAIERLVREKTGLASRKLSPAEEKISDGLGEPERVHIPEPVPSPSHADVEVKQATKRRAGERGRDLLREKTGLASTKLSPAEEKISDGLGEAERVHMSEPVPPQSNEGVEEAIKRLLREETELASTKLSPAEEKIVESVCKFLRIRTGHAEPVNGTLDELRKPDTQNLDQALRSAVMRVEEDPENVDTIITHLGWDGRRVSQAQVGRDPPINLANERATKAVSRVIERLRQNSVVPDVVERSLSLVEKSLPILETEVCEALMEGGLCFKRFSCEALLNAAKCFRTQAPFSIVKLGPSSALVKPGTAESLDQLAARVQDIMHSRGYASTTELVDDARAIFGPNASLRFTEAVLRSGGPFEWLDQETRWFWYLTDYRSSSNRLIHQIQRVLAATPRIQLTRLRSAIRRDNGLGGFAPSIKVLSFICSHLLFVRFEGETIARVPGIMNLSQTLTPNERILINVLQSHGPALQRDPLLEHCLAQGLDETAFNRLTSHSLILDKQDSGGYSIVDSIVPTPAPQNVEDERTNTSSENFKRGTLADGLLFLAWKLDAPAIQSEVLRVAEEINTFEGDYNLKTLFGHELGTLHIRQRACWDVRPLLTRSGADAGDTLVLVLNIRDQVATGVLGEDDVVANVVAGWSKIGCNALGAA
jgi:hypothetical protein